MKTWDDLSSDRKQDVLRKLEARALTDICETGGEMYEGSDVGEAIAACFAAAERMRTPWFAHEYLWDNPLVRAEIEDHTTQLAQMALYAEGHEYVISLDSVPTLERTS